MLRRTVRLGGHLIALGGTVIIDLGHTLPIREIIELLVSQAPTLPTRSSAESET